MVKSTLLSLLAVCATSATMLAGSPVYADGGAHHPGSDQSGISTSHGDKQDRSNANKPGHGKQNEQQNQNDQNQQNHQSSDNGQSNDNNTATAPTPNPSKTRADVNHIITQFEQAVSQFGKLKNPKSHGHVPNDTPSTNEPTAIQSESNTSVTNETTPLSHATASVHATPTNKATTAKSPKGTASKAHVKVSGKVKSNSLPSGGTAETQKESTTNSALKAALAQYQTITNQDQTLQTRLATSVTAYVSALESSITATQQPIPQVNSSDAMQALAFLERALAAQNQVNDGVTSLQVAAGDQNSGHSLLPILAKMTAAERQKVSDIQSALFMVQNATTAIQTAPSTG